MSFRTRKRNGAPDALAPDGSEVRLLGATARGSMAEFTLAPGTVSMPVMHRSVEEIWVFVQGKGRMWRKHDGREEVTPVEAGVSVTIPVGTAFQFRCDGSAPLVAVGVTMPPWPGMEEAVSVAGKW